MADDTSPHIHLDLQDAASQRAFLEATYPQRMAMLAPLIKAGADNLAGLGETAVAMWAQPSQQAQWRAAALYLLAHGTRRAVDKPHKAFQGHDAAPPPPPPLPTAVADMLREALHMPKLAPIAAGVCVTVHHFSVATAHAQRLVFDTAAKRAKHGDSRALDVLVTRALAAPSAPNGALADALRVLPLCSTRVVEGALRRVDICAAMPPECWRELWARQQPLLCAVLPTLDAPLVVQAALHAGAHHAAANDLALERAALHQQVETVLARGPVSMSAALRYLLGAKDNQERGVVRVARTSPASPADVREWVTCLPLVCTPHNILARHGTVAAMAAMLPSFDALQHAMPGEERRQLAGEVVAALLTVYTRALEHAHQLLQQCTLPTFLNVDRVKKGVRWLDPARWPFWPLVENILNHHSGHATHEAVWAAAATSLPDLLVALGAAGDMCPQGLTFLTRCPPECIAGAPPLHAHSLCDALLGCVPRLHTGLLQSLVGALVDSVLWCDVVAAALRELMGRERAQPGCVSDLAPGTARWSCTHSYWRAQLDAQAPALAVPSGLPVLEQLYLAGGADKATFPARVAALLQQWITASWVCCGGRPHTVPLGLLPLVLADMDASCYRAVQVLGHLRLNMSTHMQAEWRAAVIGHWQATPGALADASECLQMARLNLGPRLLAEACQRLGAAFARTLWTTLSQAWCTWADLFLGAAADDLAQVAVALAACSCVLDSACYARVASHLLGCPELPDTAVAVLLQRDAHKDLFVITDANRARVRRGMGFDDRQPYGEFLDMVAALPVPEQRARAFRIWQGARGNAHAFVCFCRDTRPTWLVDDPDGVLKLRILVEHWADREAAQQRVDIVPALVALLGTRRAMTLLLTDLAKEMGHGIWRLVGNVRGVVKHVALHQPELLRDCDALLCCTAACNALARLNWGLVPRQHWNNTLMITSVGVYGVSSAAEVRVLMSLPGADMGKLVGHMKRAGWSRMAIKAAVVNGLSHVWNVAAVLPQLLQAGAPDEDDALMNAEGAPPANDAQPAKLGFLVRPALRLLGRHVTVSQLLALTAGQPLSLGVLEVLALALHTSDAARAAVAPYVAGYGMSKAKRRRVRKARGDAPASLTKSASAIVPAFDMQAGNAKLATLLIACAVELLAHDDYHATAAAMLRGLTGADLQRLCVVLADANLLRVLQCLDDGHKSVPDTVLSGSRGQGAGAVVLPRALAVLRAMPKALPLDVMELALQEDVAAHQPARLAWAQFRSHEQVRTVFRWLATCRHLDTGTLAWLVDALGALPAADRTLQFHLTAARTLQLCDGKQVLSEQSRALLAQFFDPEARCSFCGARHGEKAGRGLGTTGCRGMTGPTGPRGGPAPTGPCGP